MRSSSRALFGRRVRTAAASHVRSGSSVRYLLRAEPSFAKTVSAAQVLATRHLPLHAATAVVERLIENQDVTVEIPEVEGAELLESELGALGIQAIRLKAAEVVKQQDLARSH